MKKKRNLILFAATALMCVFSFFLPGAVLAIRDSALNRRAETVAVDEVELNLLSSLDLTQKLTLASDVSAVSIPLEGGRVLEEKDVLSRALDVASDFGHPFYRVLQESAARAHLRVNASGEGAILWTVTLSGPTETGEVIIDDETGAALALSLASDYGGVYDDGSSLYDAFGGVLPWKETWDIPSQAAGGSDSAAPEGEAARVTEIEEFHEAASLFLSPLELETLLISIDDFDAATVHVDLDGGILAIPMRLGYEGAVSYISVNMPSGTAANPSAAQ